LLETASATGTGTATVAENYCLGAFFNTGCISSGVLQTVATNPHQDVFFAAVSKLSVIKDIIVTSNVAGDSASIAGVRNAVDESNPPPQPPSISRLSASTIAVGNEPKLHSQN
jgi:hypothetical protein